MRILDRYIRDSVVNATVLVLLVLLGVESFMEFIVQLSDIGHANYGLGHAFLYVLTALPADLYQLFPMAGFLGCLIGLGRLASTHQLMVMRASGVSVGRITWSVIKAAILMIIIVTALGEFVAPKIEAQGARMKAIAMGQLTGLKALGGVWLRDNESFIHIGSVDANDAISDITRFQINRKHVLLSADYAPTGKLVNKQWVLENVHSSVFTPQQVTQTVTAQMPLNVVFDPTLLQTGRISVDQQSIAELYQSIRYRQDAGLETNQYSFTFWQRVIQPFTTIVMICLGVPFIFGSLRSASMGLRLLTGVIIGFTFYMLNQFFGPFALVYQLPPAAAAITPTVLFAIACVILLRRSWS